MKIVYGAGKRVGANTQLVRFLEHLDKDHQIKIAAYIVSSESISHIDWTLDALHNNVIPKKHSYKLQSLFGQKLPLINFDNSKTFLSEVAKFEPDLIISDGEPFTAHVAKKLGCKLWYCSSLHLLDGVEWDHGQLRYSALLSSARVHLQKMPEPDLILVYSPWGDVKGRPFLKNGYEWIQPYHYQSLTLSNKTLAVVNDVHRFSSIAKILNGIDSTDEIVAFSPFNESFSNLKCLSFNSNEYDNYLSLSSKVITTGETSFVSDALYNEKDILIIPTLNDTEALLNANLVRDYKVGSDLGQIEFAGIYAAEQIENAIQRPYKKQFLSKQDRLFLHEKINYENRL